MTHSPKSLPHSTMRRPGSGLGQWRAKALLLSLITLGGFAFAEEAVYTWKDALGRVHFGSHPPEGQTAIPIPVQPTDRIYTWTDAEGKVHYGAHPPSDVSAKEIKEDDGSLSTIHAGKLRAGEQRLLREIQRRD